MSYPPPHGHHPHHHGHFPPPPHGHYPPPHGHYPPPPYSAPPPPGPYPQPYYVPATMMVPVPVAPPTLPEAPQNPGATYITNYIYNAETPQTPQASDQQVQIVETSGNFEWVPTTATLANALTGRALSGGHEGWDGSPLWVIRAWHNGDLIPGKLAVRHCSAVVPYDGKEVPVQNIEVLCAQPENLRWVPASNGNVPPGAIRAGQKSTGEPLYVARGRHQLSLTPGKVDPAHNCCYISFAGQEVSLKMYDVLCRVG